MKSKYFRSHFSHLYCPFQCFTPGLKAHHDGHCFDKYKCPHRDHKRFPVGESGGSSDDLPRLPENVGGETDIMIGIQYLKYFPVMKFSLPNGLTIYESQFSSYDGKRGIIGGPHRVFSEIHKAFGNC